jgi:hypothetical protein
MIAPTPKRETSRRTAGAKGGAGHMIPKQAAGPARPAITGKAPSAAPGKRAASGPRTSGHSLSVPAKAGRTAPATKGR